MCNVEFARNGADFALQLLHILASGYVHENILISPLSVQTGLALTYHGTHGDIANEIAQGAKFGSGSPADISECFHSVYDKYRNNDNLKFANKVYVKSGLKIKDQYVADAKKNYLAEAESIDFSSDTATQSINAWVEAETAGKIKNLLQPNSVDADTDVVLLDALHFKSNWKTKFPQKNTVKDTFSKTENVETPIEVMVHEFEVDTAEFPEYGFSVVDLPYEDSDLSMFIILPSEIEGLKNVAEKLKNVNLLDLSKKLVKQQRTVSLPKFKLEYATELNGPLQTLGIKQIFEDVQFTNMLDSSDRLHISKVLHKTSFEVNEAGAEAAAATVAVAEDRLENGFDAKQPFMFFIWNRKNIFFAGTVVDL